MTTEYYSEKLVEAICHLTRVIQNGIEQSQKQHEALLAQLRYNEVRDCAIAAGLDALAKLSKQILHFAIIGAANADLTPEKQELMAKMKAGAAHMTEVGARVDSESAKLDAAQPKP